MTAELLKIQLNTADLEANHDLQDQTPQTQPQGSTASPMSAPRPRRQPIRLAVDILGSSDKSSGKQSSACSPLMRLLKTGLPDLTSTPTRKQILSHHEGSSQRKRGPGRAIAHFSSSVNSRAAECHTLKMAEQHTTALGSLQFGTTANSVARERLLSGQEGAEQRGVPEQAVQKQQQNRDILDSYAKIWAVQDDSITLRTNVATQNAPAENSLFSTGHAGQLTLGNSLFCNDYF